MICLIALVVFGILGLFSVKYRIIAKEAFDCVFRRVTLRKCTTGLDKRLKSQITGNLMRHSPGLAKFTYKHFEIISWFFTMLLIASLVQTGISIYNYAAYGSCNGQDSEGFCIFDPLGTGNQEIKCSTEVIQNCIFQQSETAASEYSKQLNAGTDSGYEPSKAFVKEHRLDVAEFENCIKENTKE